MAFCSKWMGRPSVDPVVLIKMVLIQHLFGLPSLRQTWEIDVNVAYRWFLGYDLLEPISHFATVSYAFCKRFPPELSTEIFDYILNKVMNNKRNSQSYREAVSVKCRELRAGGS